MSERFTTISDLAREIGITRTGVLKKVWRKEIKAFKLGNNFIVDRGGLPHKISLRKNNKVRWVYIQR